MYTDLKWKSVKYNTISNKKGKNQPLHRTKNSLRKCPHPKSPPKHPKSEGPPSYDNIECWVAPKIYRTFVARAVQLDRQVTSYTEC